MLWWFSWPGVRVRCGIFLFYQHDYHGYYHPCRRIHIDHQVNRTSSAVSISVTSASTSTGTTCGYQNISNCAHIMGYYVYTIGANTPGTPEVTISNANSVVINGTDFTYGSTTLSGTLGDDRGIFLL